MGASSSTRQLKVPDYEEGKVYMFNFPSCRNCPTMSPFALKLETWLRMNKISHEVIRNGGNRSSKGQIPFIELNGKEYNESTLVIDFLTKEFNKDDGLSEEQKGLTRCVMRAVDNQLAQSYFFFRYGLRPQKTIGMMEFLSPAMSKIFKVMAPTVTRSRMRDHGIGLHSDDMIAEIGCKDIAAIGQLLGNKQFLMGDRMTTVDCAVFGHLAQIKYLEIDYPHKEFMQQKVSNVWDYLDRIKDELWPDWKEISENHLR